MGEVTSDVCRTIDVAGLTLARQPERSVRIRRAFLFSGSSNTAGAYAFSEARSALGSFRLGATRFGVNGWLCLDTWGMELNAGTRCSYRPHIPCPLPRSRSRRLTADTRIILLDEPNESIQPSIVEEIEKIVIQLNRDVGLTVVLVEQKVSFVRGAEKRHQEVCDQTTARRAMCCTVIFLQATTRWASPS